MAAAHMGNPLQKLLFGVRTLVSSELPDREAGVRSFEERVVIIEAANFDQAIAFGQEEAKRYVSELPRAWNAILIDDVQAFEIGAEPIRPGVEVWSVIRHLKMTNDQFREHLGRGDEVRILKSESVPPAMIKGDAGKEL